MQYIENVLYMNRRAFYSLVNSINNYNDSNNNHNKNRMVINPM